jgi:hypothetical protein
MNALIKPFDLATRKRVKLTALFFRLHKRQHQGYLELDAFLDHELLARLDYRQKHLGWQRLSISLPPD